MELKKLIKNTSFLVTTKVAQFLTGIVRAKINAIHLGTTGVGLFNQLNFLTYKMSQFTMLSMNDAVVKQIAENRDDQNIKEIIASSLKGYIFIVSLFVIIIVILLIIFSQQLSAYVYGDIKYKAYIYLAILSFPILILNSIPFAILKGFRNVKAISLAQISITAVNLIIYIPLVLIYNLKGAMYYLPISYIVTALINYVWLRKTNLKENRITFGNVLRAPINFIHLKEMILFSGFGLIVGLAAIVSEFMCRSVVVKHLGVDMIGLYAPIITWSELIIGFLLPSFNTYLYPRFCEVNSNKEVNGILNDAIRLGTFFLIPLLFIGIPYKEILIKLFYSFEFISASKYLPYHFLGVCFYVWFNAMTMSLTPTGRIKWNAAFLLLYYFTDVLIVIYFVPRIGLYGWMLKFIISPVLYSTILYLLLNKKINFKFSKKNIWLMMYLLMGALLIIALGFIDNTHYIVYTIGPILLLLTYFLLKKNEKDDLYKAVGKYFKRKTKI